MVGTREEGKEMKSKFDGNPETMLDTLASYARTALDDPGIMVDEQGRQVAGTGYALDRLDEIINVLNPALETRETFAEALTILGRHIAERQDVIEAVNVDDDDPAKEEAVRLLEQSLDYLDAAIDVLTQGPHSGS